MTLVLVVIGHTPFDAGTRNFLVLIGIDLRA